MEEVPEAFDLANAEIVFKLDRRSMGELTLNGRNMHNFVESAHIHITAGFAPTMTLRITGFDFEAKAILIEGALKWPKED